MKKKKATTRKKRHIICYVLRRKIQKTEGKKRYCHKTKNIAVVVLSALT